MDRAMTSLLGVAACAVLVGCSEFGDSNDINNVPGARVVVHHFDLVANRAVDVLFVVDDSPSMGDKQRNLRENFSRFIGALDRLWGGLPDLHVGVVSTDLGTSAGAGEPGAPIAGDLAEGGGACSGRGKDGVLQVGAAAAALGGARFLSDVRVPGPDSGRLRNYEGDLATVFGQMATLGSSGCSFEQPLAAMRRALDGNTENAGFLRDDAYLVVVFVTDEDDCSLANPDLLGPASAELGPLQSMRCTRFGVTCEVGGQTPDAMNQPGAKAQCTPNEQSPYLASVQGYVEFLRGVKADPSMVMVAGIMGTSDPVEIELRTPPGGGPPSNALAPACSDTGADGVEVAAPTTRLQHLLGQFPSRSTFTTICQRELAGELAEVGQLLKSKLALPCLSSTPRDADLDTPGNQFDCSVSWVNGDGTARRERVLPACGSGETPCWTIETSNLCLSDQPALIVVDNGGQAPPSTLQITQCAVAD